MFPGDTFPAPHRQAALFFATRTGTASLTLCNTPVIHDFGRLIPDSSQISARAGGKVVMTEYQPLDKIHAEEFSGRLAGALRETEKVIVGQREMLEGAVAGA